MDSQVSRNTNQLSYYLQVSNLTSNDNPETIIACYWENAVDGEPVINGTALTSHEWNNFMFASTWILYSLHCCFLESLPIFIH